MKCKCRKCESENLIDFRCGRFIGYYCNDCFFPESLYHQCCKNQDVIFVRVEQGNGLVQRTACKNCKSIFGANIKKDKDFHKYPLVTKEKLSLLRADDEKNRDDFNNFILNKHRQHEDLKKDTWSRNYSRYLATGDWQLKRHQVLKRDNYICQGCLTNKATEVHHLTYDNVTDELLFQLVSVCRNCHDKIHSK